MDFVVKLSTLGGPFLYASYIGGSGNENQYAYMGPERTWTGVAVIPGGAAYIVGATSSTDFSTVNPLQGTLGDAYDGFAAKVSVQTDLRLTMTDSPDPARLGNTVTYVTRFESDPVGANNSASVTTTVRSRLSVTVNGTLGATAASAAFPRESVVEVTAKSSTPAPPPLDYSHLPAQIPNSPAGPAPATALAHVLFR